MTEPDILYPAIFVFSMLLIGLVLTMWEFSRQHKRGQQKVNKDKRVAGLGSSASGGNVRKVSNF
ncbi:MAG: hypothetical protein WBN08_04615 [Thiogranum sp.]